MHKIFTNDNSLKYGRSFSFRHSVNLLNVSTNLYYSGLKSNQMPPVLVSKIFVGSKTNGSRVLELTLISNDWTSSANAALTCM